MESGARVLALQVGITRVGDRVLALQESITRAGDRVLALQESITRVGDRVLALQEGITRVPDGDLGSPGGHHPRARRRSGQPRSALLCRVVDGVGRPLQALGVPRFFNTAGPNDPRRHYTLPVLARLPSVRRLVDQGLYFVLHAPRQVGKTTALLALGRELTAEGAYVAILVSMEVGAAFPRDPGAAELAILDAWRDRAQAWLPAELQPPAWPDAPAGRRLGMALRTWAQAAPRPLVLFLDEIDALQDEVLISALRQIRDSYANRPTHFPHALALVGMRDVRDYRVASGSSGRLGSASPFNIKAESLTLRNFTHDEVRTLYGQHTAETGQVFLDDAVARAFHLTQGQPWLVNALARQLTEELVQDHAEPITVAHVDQARDILIRRQDTHLDSLIERLREPRVRAIVEPMLAGDTLGDVPEDDRRFVVDLGLLRRSESGGLEVANPIYREVIVRTLAGGARDSIPTPALQKKRDSWAR